MMLKNVKSIEGVCSFFRVHRTDTTRSAFIDNFESCGLSY